MTDTGTSVHSVECDPCVDEIGESHITECFESLYLAAAAQDNEIKASRAGIGRIESFLHSHSQLPTREERLAHVRHRVEAPAMQLQQHHSMGSRAAASEAHSDGAQSPEKTHAELAGEELPTLPSGLLPLNANGA